MASKRALVRLICALAATAAFVFAARPGDFRPLGPGGGGAMFNPTISPHDPRTVLVSCDMTGGYITHDAGHSWRMFNLRGTIAFFAFDPKDPHTIYARATGLWRSRDSGETWSLLYPRPGSLQGVRMADDHADEQLVADPDPLGTISALAIDVKNSGLLYVAASKGGASSLFLSRDSGATWTKGSGLPEPARHIWIKPHPGAADELVIAGEHAILHKIGYHVETHGTPGPLSEVSAGFAKQGLVLYALFERGVQISRDFGAHWTTCPFPGTGAQLRAISTGLHTGGTAYVSYSNLQLDHKTWAGVAKTIDEGKSWRLVWKESVEPASNVHDAWITSRFGPQWGENPLTIGVDETNPNLCYTTDLGRTMKSSDGGATWTAVYSHKVSGGAWTSSGLDVTTAYGVHVDPFDHQRRFITYTDIGLFRSEDGGHSWQSSTAGVPQNWLNTTYWIVFDPAVRGRMWSVNSGTHDLPRPKMWRHNSPLHYLGGVCRSDDGGKTWISANQGMAETAATHILLDTRSPPDRRTLYVAAFGRGVYKSTDGAKSWTLKNNGINQVEPFAWRLAQSSNGTIYLLVARRSEDGSIGNQGDGALYESTDGAESWTRVALPDGVNAPNGLAVDPTSARRLYLAAWARADGMHGEGGGVFVSDDAGHTWHRTLDGDQHVYDVTVDSRDPRVLYAAGFESSAWSSTDRGEHWARVAGFNFKWGHRVIPDPDEPSSVYITTFGGSVWHGNINGIPRPLDIVTPRLEPETEP